MIRLLKVFSVLDNAVSKVLGILVSFTVGALIVVVTIQVFARYVLFKSIGGVEEMPISLMMIGVWLGAPLVARADMHLKIELLELIIKNKALAARILKTVVHVIILVCLCLFTRFALIYVQGSYAMYDITPGLNMPIWWMHSLLFISALLMAIYYFTHVVRDVIALKGGAKTWS